MNNKGIALLISLVIISLIVGIAVNLTNITWVDISESAVFRDRILAKTILVSELNYAIGIMAKDKEMNNVDSFLDIWADAEELNNNFREWAEADTEIVIHDEGGKIKINSLVKTNGEYNTSIANVLLRLLKGPAFSLSTEEAQDILDSIKDWLDKDNEPTRFGAESSYYQEKGAAYGAKNGSLDCLEELLMIKGVTPELYYGKEGLPGLKDLLRLSGGDRININTAPMEVLMALADNISADAAEAMMEYRRVFGNDLSKPDWYKSVPGMAGVEVQADLLTTAGGPFKVVCRLKTPATQRALIALLERQGGKVRVLDWKME